MTYWITRTNTMRKNANGDFAEIEVTSKSFATAAEADAYVKKLNDEHHEYMLRTHDRTELGITYGAMTDERIAEGWLRGINIIDKRP